MNNIAVVIIGRNEGARLISATKSVRQHSPAGTAVVYVDSGSVDGSAAAAASMGCEVVELDLAIPFSAARARNAGADLICSTSTAPAFIFFMDGDCQLCPGFIDSALEQFLNSPALAVICGRRCELKPDRNIYHRLADMEWNTIIGPARACGGDAVFRASAFREVGGFDDSVAAGEEPELCVRLLAAGHQVLRIDADMTLHDVNMTGFRQWWRRSERSGQAFAQGAWMHGRSTQRHWIRHALRVWFWTLLPVVAVMTLPSTGGKSLLVLPLYTIPLYRAFVDRRRRNDSTGNAVLYSIACLVAKFAEFVGELRFIQSLIFHRGRTKILEYKSIGEEQRTLGSDQPS